jgi:hypothetical protein
MNATEMAIEGISNAAEAIRRVVGVDGQREQRAADQWLAVTVNRGPEQVQPDGQLPDPLARIRDRIELQIRPAPGDKGTEIYARPRQPVPSGVGAVAARVTGTDPRQEVRLALRAAKSILECGEVVQPDRHTTTKRTITNLPLELAIKRARGEGRL